MVQLPLPVCRRIQVSLQTDFPVVGYTIIILASVIQREMAQLHKTLSCRRRQNAVRRSRIDRSVSLDGR